MCTAISFVKKNHYFGRNMDYEHSFGEGVVITPKNYKFSFSEDRGYALCGGGITVADYPLYFDAFNEHGLAVAGLNFPDNAFYNPEKTGMKNIASFEFIPWILRQCKTVKEAKKMLAQVNITNEHFSQSYPPSPLHWIISDRKQSITAEPVKSGLKIYDNPAGVLTNNPEFNIQLFNLNNYMHISKMPAKNRFSNKLSLAPYSRGMGGVGLPGDLSSQSRFVKATFVKFNSVCGDSEAEIVSQFFHMLYSVYQQRGCVMLKDGTYEITRYSSCCNADKGIYYYTTYENHSINAVNMKNHDLNGGKLLFYPFNTEFNINFN